MLPYLPLCSGPVVLTMCRPGIARQFTEQVVPMPLIDRDDAFQLVTRSLLLPLDQDGFSLVHALIQQVGRLPTALVRLHEILAREASMPQHFHEHLRRLHRQDWFFERNSSLAIALRESEARLSLSVRRMFRVLVARFLEVPFTGLDALAALRQPQALNDLDLLLDAGLVVRAEQGGYQFHPLVVAYVRLTPEAD